MTQIVSILRAAHCRSTHHFFAVDALSRIDTAQGQRLGSILLKYHDEYLTGAKAPDTSFRDFQNHVIHISDGNWGGAPKACEKWLAEVVEHLDRGRWKKAAYACGVLSHYFTDPLMPLHTGQTKRESALHRPMEWSICKAYNEIYSQLTEEQLSVNFQLASGPGWIRNAVLAGATVAHQHYGRLIEIYDLEQGARNPPAGLNEEARAILCELFCIAITGWANVLSRIADTTTTDLPEVSLGLTSLLAAIDMPLAWIVRRLSDRSEKLAVRAIFEEYQKTGDVRKNLPQEIKVVSELRELDTAHTESVARSRLDAIEQLATAPKTNAAAASPRRPNRQLNSLSLPTDKAPDTASLAPPVRSVALEHRTPMSQEETASPAEPTGGVPGMDPSVTAPRHGAETGDNKLMFHVFLDSLPNESVANERPALAAAVPTAFGRPPERGASVQGSVAPQASHEARVSFASKLVDAPSIGPKTARRFERIGITSIGQFIAADPAAMVSKLAASWINEQLLRDWQAQAKLVCELGCLCGYKSQLLVAAACVSVEQLASYSAAELHRKLQVVSASSDGQRILRSSAVPTLSDAATWIQAAQQHTVARNRRVA